MPFSFRVVVFILMVVCSADADTIVLKNGRHIVAENVTETADRVTYQTPAGELSLPKSIVARIDRDNFRYFTASPPGGEPPVSAPQIEPVRGYEEVAGLTIHDNAIDFAYLARLEADARTGAAIPIERVAAARYAAAQFLIERGDTDDAINQYRQALIFAPDNAGLLLNLAVLYLHESQFTAAPSQPTASMT